MSDKNNTVIVEDSSGAEIHRELGENETISGSSAYMNRLFCSTHERIAYILKSSFGKLDLGEYDTNTDFFLYKIFGLSPTAYAKANVGLGIYDMINDPVSAAIIDNMRSRWGKFKPFQFISLLPSLILGILTCLIPLMNLTGNNDAGQKLWIYMAILYANETVGAFFGGGNTFIDNVFTPNPNERTSLLVSSKFVSDLFGKLPTQLMGLLLDIIDNGKIDINIIKVYVVFKTVIWLMTTIPNIYWIIVSKERVSQSEKPPSPIKGILSVFKNRPLLVYTLSGFVDSIDIGTNGTLYYSDVLHFKSLKTIAGIPGSPVSYASYAFVPKFREKFSTKALWMMQRGSIITSQLTFFLTGLIGGKTNGFYKKKIPMTIAFALGNCLEMVFFATKKIVGSEINYEVLDYCEWKNGYRVEATIGLLTGYFNKVKDILLKIVNAWLLERWAGYQSGYDAVQTSDTQFRMFITAFGPKLIFDIICLIPMLFYNIDQKTREKMYLDLEKIRSETAQKATELANLENNNS